MDVTVSVRHFTLNEDVRRHAVEMVESAFADFRLKISQINVVLDMQRDLVTASISVAIKDNPVSSQSSAYDNPYKALDEAITKVAEQAKRYLDKKQDHRATGLAAEEAAKANAKN